MSALDEVKKVIDRIEKLNPEWRVERTYMANSSELYHDTKIPETFWEPGIGMFFTTPDGIKIEISKTSGYHSFSTKWRDSTVFYWTFEISVRTKEREIVFEKTFLDSRKMGREGFRYDSSVCKYLDDFLNKVGVPVLVAREEQAMREWKEREARRLAEEKEKPPPPPSAKDRFWNG